MLPRICFPLALVFFLSAPVAGAGGQAADERIRYDLTTQPLADALQTFARQSRLQLIYDAQIVRNITAGQLNDHYSPVEALALLLHGTGLEFQFANDHTVIITRRTDQQLANERSAQKPLLSPSGTDSIVEEISRESRDGPAREDPESESNWELAIPEILVTGSRIARTGMETPTPTTVLNSETVELSGVTNIIDIVNELPAIGPGLTRSNTNFTFSFAGLGILNLRNLGTERTLVLVNGRRHVASFPGTAAVDVSTIPVALVDRTEVITGGASAIYGADAVSGVINFIMNDSFEGVRLDFQGGISQKGDGEEFALSASAGRFFSERRGHMALNLTYSSSAGIVPAARNFASAALEFLPNPDNTGQGDGHPDLISFANVRNIEASTSGAVRLPASRDDLRRNDGISNIFTFDAGGNLRAFDLGTGLVGDNRHVGEGDGDIVSLRDMLQVPLDRFLISGFGSYKLALHHKIFFEAKFSNIQSSAQSQPVFDFASFTEPGVRGIVLSMDNPFIQDDLRTILIGDPDNTEDDIDEIIVSRTNLEFGNRGQDVSRQTMRFVAGIEGLLWQDWDYNIYYQFGRTRSDIIKRNDRFQARFLQSLDAVRDPDSGEIVCRDQSNGCIPFNPLGPPGTASPEAVAFSRFNSIFRDRLTQHVAGAVIDGLLANLPAGPVVAVLGVEYRREESSSLPPIQSQRGEGFFNVRLSPVSGSYGVREAFSELAVPLLAEQPFAHILSVEAAVRWADYSLSGSAVSWRFGGEWMPVPDFRFRMAYSRAVRAPNITELFQPGSEGFPRIDDPCDVAFINNTPNRAVNCAALGVPEGFVPNNREVGQRTVVKGNSELDVETAKTLTVGAVFTPAAIPEFSLTVDYWKITINDAITSFPAQKILENCVDAPTIENMFCDAQMRDPAGDVSLVTTQNINISRFKAGGIDLEANYRWNLGMVKLPGTVRFSFIGTYLDRLDFILPPDLIDRQAGEIGIPKWRFRSNALYNKGPISLDWQLRYVGNSVRDIQELPEVRFPQKIGAEFYSDIQLRYRLREELTLFAGVNNLLNNRPPIHPDTFQGGTALVPNAIIYDNIGRFFYLGLNVKFS